MEIRLRPVVTVSLAGFVALALGGGIWWATQPPDSPREGSVPVAAEAQPPIAAPSPAATPTRAVRPAASSTDYTGDQACAKCHADIAKQFAASAMGRSLTVASESASTLREEVLFRPGGKCVYRVRPEAAGELTHSEQMQDADGQLIYDASIPVHYTMGSGTRGKSYITNHDGILTMSPISWFADGNRWDLSPGFAPDDPRGFGRRVIDECVACHAGQVALLPGHFSKFAADPFPHLSIGCENCHGPGQSHVAVQEGKLPADQDSIVNPAKLAAAERESVCNQCHLQGEARIPRYGRTYFDFRPGQKLEDTLVVFQAGTGVSEGKTESVRHVQQMMSSRCFQASEGKLGCISCHDAHGTIAKEDAASFYRERCLTCHASDDCHAPAADRHEQSDSCFACHMPRLSASDIAHTAQTDHRILIRPEQPAKAAPASGPPKLEIFGQADQRMPPWESARASGLAVVKHLLDQGRTPDFSRIESLLAPGLEIAPDDTRVMIALTEVALKNHHLQAAEKYARQALEVDPQNEPALVALTLVAYQSGRYAEGLDFANQALAINPTLDKIYAHQADMLRLTGRLPEGIAAAEKSLKLNPRLLTVREWLIRAYRDLGQIELADQHKSILDRMDGAPTVQ